MVLLLKKDPFAFHYLDENEFPNLETQLSSFLANQINPSQMNEKD